jgi:predicted phage terminase large subunit-like protein
MKSLTSHLNQFDGSSLRGLQSAMQREAQRRAAARSLIDFTGYTYPRYEAASIHFQIAEQLERVARDEVDRLMLLVPPRHGKSELASRRFPAWYLDRHPDKQFISASASFALAEDFGRDVRNLMNSEEYQQVFDTRLAEDSQARGRWTTTEGGSYFATGVGGALMGRGAHMFLIDDPFGSMADARSEPARKNVHDWFSANYSRLEKNGKIILINHRMHQDDLSGRLLAQQAAGGDQWTVVELKAVSSEGEALWPEKFDSEALARIKANTTAQDWAALYQQEPTQEVGCYFKDEWLISIIDLPPRGLLNVYGASDYAVTSNGGDYTVHVVIGIDPKRRLFLLDLWRQQTSSNVWIEAWCDLVTKWKPAFWAEEKSQITSGVGPFITARARERQAYTSREQFPTRHDKAVRAQSIRGRMELDGLYVPARAPWLADLKAELLAFPTGKHDDIVDALGLVGQLLDKVSPGIRPQPEQFERKWAYQPPSELIEDQGSSIKLL